MRESHVRHIPLLEEIEGGKGKYTTVSVLEPSVRIERTKEGDYRIIAFFKLQVEIHAFDDDYTKKGNKFFDSVSLRYLFCKGERHEVIPLGDEMLRNINVNNSETISKYFELGLSASAPGGTVAPNIGAHIQQDNTVTCDYQTKSWRKGLSFESYSRPRKRTKKATKATKHTVHTDHTVHTHFQAHMEQHITRCVCCQYIDDSKCVVQNSNPYNRCAHWYLQTEAQAHLWKPEIYETLLFPVTIIRIVSVEEINRVQSDSCSSDMVRYLHFDFVVKTRLRELGRRWKDLFRRPTKPAEARIKETFGSPLPSDKIKFCVWICAASIPRGWPYFPTRDMQEEVKAKASKTGTVPRKLPSDKERVEELREEHEKKHEAQYTAHVQSQTGLRGGAPEEGLERRKSEEPIDSDIEYSYVAPESFPGRRNHFERYHRSYSPRRGSLRSIDREYLETHVRRNPPRGHPSIVVHETTNGDEKLEMDRIEAEREERRLKTELELKERRKNIKRLQKKCNPPGRPESDSDSTIELSSENEDGKPTNDPRKPNEKSGVKSSTQNGTYDTQGVSQNTGGRSKNDPPTHREARSPVLHSTYTVRNQSYRPSSRHRSTRHTPRRHSSHRNHSAEIHQPRDNALPPTITVQQRSRSRSTSTLTDN